MEFLGCYAVSHNLATFMNGEGDYFNITHPRKVINKHRKNLKEYFEFSFLSQKDSCIRNSWIQKRFLSQKYDLTVTPQETLLELLMKD